MNKIKLLFGLLSLFGLFSFLFIKCSSRDVDKPIAILENQAYGFEQQHTYDLYYPIDVENPPLLIFAHSGAFITGNKNNHTSEELARNLAKKGIAVACINYSLIDKRIGWDRESFDKITHYEKFLKREIHEAICDTHRAIKHFKSGGSELEIDRDNIFLGGFSAGGILALQLYFVSPEQTNILFGVNNNEIYSGEYKAGVFEKEVEGEASSMLKGIVSIGGGVFNMNSTLGYKNKDIPLLMIHGTDDEIVLPYQGRPFYCNNDIDITLYEIGVGSTQDTRIYSSTLNDILSGIASWITDAFIPFDLGGSHNIKELHKENRNIIYKPYEGAKHNFFVDDKGKTTKNFKEMTFDINEFIIKHKYQKIERVQKKSNRY